MDNVHTSPKVSIVLPTHNGSQYIRQSIESCLKQTYRNIELIIVNDNSTDITPDIINSYKDDRINYIEHERNMGLPHSLNSGFKLAQGEYLTWTSDDNLYAKDAIEKMAAFLLANNSHFVYCDYFSFNNSDMADLSLIQLPSPATFENINGVRACFLYARKVMEVTGNYDPDAMLVEDYDYWIRVSKKFSMLHLSIPLYYYRNHKYSLYNTRFQEVEIAKLLVRLKYNIMDTKGVNYYLRNLVIKNKKKFHFPKRILAKVFLAKKLDKILMDFQTKKEGITQSRLRLLRILNNRLLSAW